MNSSCERKGRRTDLTKQLVDFRSCANASANWLNTSKIAIQICSFRFPYFLSVVTLFRRRTMKQAGNVARIEAKLNYIPCFGPKCCREYTTWKTDIDRSQKMCTGHAQVWRICSVTLPRNLFSLSEQRFILL